MASGRLVFSNWMPALDADGVPIPNAQMFFYVNRTTTLATVYADEALTTPLANPVLADSSGQFVPVWADQDLLFSAAIASTTLGQFDTIDDLAPSNSVGGATNKLDRDGGNPEPDFLTNVGAASISGDNLTDPNALAFRSSLGVYGLPVELYGATANDIAVDNTMAINAAETAAALTGVSVIFREGANYYFQGTLRGARDRLTWTGNRTRLIYNGASTTRDLIVFGNEATIGGGSPSYYRELTVMGIELCSRTVMTAGWAVRTPGCVRSNFGIVVQPQDFCEEMVNAGIGTARNGVCTWQGIWSQFTDNNRYRGDSLNAYTICFAWNGRSDAAGGGPKADNWLLYGKISQGRSAPTTDNYPAVLMGGGAGGLYLTPDTTYIGNCVNLRVDQSLTAEANRELFCTGSIFDVALGVNNYNVEVLDPGGVLINAAPVWISAGQGGGLLIGAGSSGQLVGSALRIRGHQKHGLTILSPNFFINVAALQVHNNGLAADVSTPYWGVNGAVANYSLTYASLSSFSNGYLGGQNINGAFANTGISDNSRARFPNIDVRQRTYFGADTNFWMGEGDAPNYNPSILYDSGDATFYDRSGNSLADVIGSAVAFRVVGDRILIRDNTAILPGTGTPEGVVTANPGSLFQRTDNGTIYRKGSGTGNTGWVLMT